MLKRDKNNTNRGNSYSQLCAFTLAEVLITLGIIGVVAAMTIPTWIICTAITSTGTAKPSVTSR